MEYWDLKKNLTIVFNLWNSIPAYMVLSLDVDNCWNHDSYITISMTTFLPFSKTIQNMWGTAGEAKINL